MSGGGNVDSGGWTNLRFPNAFAHPFEVQGRDGKVRKRMLVTIPKGVVLADGRDLGGWSLSVHASPWALAQKQAGRPVSIGLRVGRSVELFKGRGARRRVLRLDGPEDLRIALDEHRDRMTGRHTDSGKPFENDSTTRTSMASRERVRGSLDDAAPPSYGPADGDGAGLFNDLAFDTGFVSRMDVLVSGFADDFAHVRYDADIALSKVRTLVAEAACLFEMRNGVNFHDDAVGCAAILALSAVTDAINGRVDDLVDRGEADPRVAAANRVERSDGHGERPDTLRCLRMFTTAYGKTGETDVFGDAVSVAGPPDGIANIERTR